MSGWYGPKSRLWRIWQICTWSEFWIIKTVDVSCNCSANAVDTVFFVGKSKSLASVAEAASHA